MDIDMLGVIYDTLFDFTQKLIEEHNPCKVIKDNDGRLSCIGSPDQTYRCQGSLCCTGSCRHLKSRGCATRNLRCKVYFCKKAYHNLPDHILIKLDVVHFISCELGFMRPWKSRRRVLKESFQELGKLPPKHYGHGYYHNHGYYYNKKYDEFQKQIVEKACREVNYG